MRPSYEFLSVEQDHPIRADAYPEFYFLLQQAALLSLKDAGYLTQTQYCAAEKLLRSQSALGQTE